MQKVKQVLLRINHYQINLILGIIYIMLVPVFAVFLKLKQDKNQTSWSKWKIKANSLEQVRKQS